MTSWKLTPREPAKTKAELREMLAEAVRNTQPQTETKPSPKAKKGKGRPTLRGYRLAFPHPTRSRSPALLVSQFVVRSVTSPSLPQSFYDLLTRIDGKFRRLYREACHVVRPASCGTHLRCRQVAHLPAIKTLGTRKKARDRSPVLCCYFAPVWVH